MGYKCYHSACTLLEVQSTAASAVDWCEKRGGKVGPGDTISKIASLGADGKYGGNIERDMHTYLGSLCRRLGAKISTVQARTLLN